MIKSDHNPTLRFPGESAFRHIEIRFAAEPGLRNLFQIRVNSHPGGWGEGNMLKNSEVNELLPLQVARPDTDKLPFNIDELIKIPEPTEQNVRTV